MELAEQCPLLPRSQVWLGMGLRDLPETLGETQIMAGTSLGISLDVLMGTDLWPRENRYCSSLLLLRKDLEKLAALNQNISFYHLKKKLLEFLK